MNSERRTANLLVITQKVDANDDLLGFFVGWLREFSRQFESVSVITLAKGEYDLPPNVRVYSLGKEKNTSKFIRLITFYRLLVTLVPNSNGIFAHMSPVFAVASWPVAALFRKRVILWYLHRSLTGRLKVAEKLCYKIVTADKESLTLKSSKVVEVGHGIDADLFRTGRDWQKNPLHNWTIISVGRLSPIKNYETLFRAVRTLKDWGLAVKAHIVGQPVMAKDFEYRRYLESLREQLDLEDVVWFDGLIIYPRMPQQYRSADIAVNLTPKGGLDKAMLEAMAAGCLALTSNEAFGKLLGPHAGRLIFKHGDPKDLAEKITALARLPADEQGIISDFLVQAVNKEHTTAQVVDKISRLFK